MTVYAIEEAIVDAGVEVRVSLAGQLKLGPDGEGGVEVEGRFVAFSLALEEEGVEVKAVVDMLRTISLVPYRPKEKGKIPSTAVIGL